MIKVCFVRGKYLNNFEGQNYIFSQKGIQFTAVSSLFPLNRHFPFPVQRLPSLADIPIFKPGVKYLGNRLLGDSQILFGLEKFAGHYDICHTADPHYYYSYQLARMRQKNLIKKLIMTSWETIPFNNESIDRKKQLKYFSLSQADYFICYTEKAKNTLIREGVDPKKISLIRLGVDINRFKTQSSKLKEQNQNLKIKNLTILFVGRLVEEKGILDLYEAYKQIQSSIPSNSGQNSNLKLKIIGDGPLKSKLERSIAKDNLRNSVSIEKKEYEDMPKVYQEADIFVLPSFKTKTWEEQYGMVLVEAMASSLPIVAYKTGAISEVVGHAGMLIKEGDKKSLASSIKHLLEVREFGLKLGKMGRERAEKEFDAQKTAKKIKSIYFQIAKPT